MPATFPRPHREPLIPTNVRLPRDLKIEASRVAVSRYNWSRSELIKNLLKQEISHKRGLIPQKFR